MIQIRTITIILLAWFGSFPLFSQGYVDYYNIVNEAEWKLYNYSYEDAIELYQKAFRMKEPKAVDHFRMAEALVGMGNVDLALEHLRKASEKGIRLVYHFKWKTTSRLYIRFKTDSLFQHKVTELDSLGALVWTKLKDQRVADTIKYFRSMDQLYRKEQVSYPIESPQYLENKALFKRQDSITSQELLKYLKENPYPDVRIYGEGLASILTHVDCSAYHELKEVLYQQLLDGYIPPIHFAPMVDRIGCTCDGELRYNSYIDWCSPKNQEEAIKNRRSIGMSLYFRDNNLIPNLPKRDLFQSSNY